MTAAEFRRLALAYPAAVEALDGDAIHFKVGGRTFARLATPAAQWAEVKLSRKDWQATSGEPELIGRMPGGWFHHGYTQLNLAKIADGDIASVLDAAFRHATRRRFLT